MRRIAVTSIVVFDIPDDPSIDTVAQRLRLAHEAMIGRPMETLTGQLYILRRIERLDVLELGQEREACRSK